MIDEILQVGDVEYLHDERFPWVERRRGAMTLAQIYDYAGYKDYAVRAGSCATFLQFNAMLDGSRTLRAANFCQLRLCPMCTARRAKRAAYKLNQVLDMVQGEHECRYVFLTLTIRNVDGHQLGPALGRLTEGFHRLVRHREVERAVKGWYRAIEITRNPARGDYHPHIHAILAVEPEYFARSSGLYISQADWRRKWALAARLDYDPSVHIQRTHGRDGGEDRKMRGATLEAAKYCTKDSDWLDPGLTMDDAAKIVTDYTTALYRRRLTAFGGWLKTAARALDADRLEDDTELVHVDDTHIRDDVADLIETYNWRFGAGDYVLASRELNPLKVVRIDSATGEVITTSR